MAKNLKLMSHDDCHVSKLKDTACIDFTLV